MRSWIWNKTAGVQATAGSGQEYLPASERADRLWHRLLAGGVLLAILFHLAVLLAFRTTRVPPAVFSAAGPQAGDYRAAAGGGGGMEMVQVRTQEQRAPVEEALPEPVPVPDVEVVVEPAPDPDPVRVPDVALAVPGVGTAGVGAGLGETTGPGLADGRGQGGGGTEAEGSSGLIAPRPRGLFLPPQGVPSDAKGREITVYVFVTEQGRVIGDSTRLDPPTRDARFNRRLRDQASEWVFEPARRSGHAVSAWFSYGLTL